MLLQRILSRPITWVKSKYVGPIPTLGWFLAAGEIGAKILFARPIDPEVLPIAGIFILYQPAREKQKRRNDRRDKDRKDGEDDEKES